MAIAMTSPTQELTPDQADRIVRQHLSGLEERRREIASHIAGLHSLAVPLVYEELYIDEDRGRIKATAYLWEACARKAGLIAGPVRFRFDGDGVTRICIAEAVMPGGDVISATVEFGDASDADDIDGVEFESIDVRMAALARKILLRTEFPLLLMERSAEQTVADMRSVSLGPDPVGRDILSRSSTGYRVAHSSRSTRDRQATFDQRRQQVSGETSQETNDVSDSLAARFESEIRTCPDLGELGSIEAAIQRAASLTQWERDELFNLCDQTRESFLKTT